MKVHLVELLLVGQIIILAGENIRNETEKK